MSAPADAPLAEQLTALASMVERNPVVVTILRRLDALQVPDCWLAAGAVFQTVWNVISGRDPGEGIRDYDVNYFDGSDLSWEGEDAVIRRAATVFGDLDAEVEVRNEARVHLWYEERFGVACPPYRSTAHAISTFPNCSSCLAVRRAGDGGLEVCAPFGLSDLFAMRCRPNPVLAPREVYEAKTDRWREQWPRLEVHPWPLDPASTAACATRRGPSDATRR